MPQSTQNLRGRELLCDLVSGLDENAVRDIKEERVGKGLEGIFSDGALMNACFSLFDNDLNVSRTAEKLYMHRNTLIYSLKKIERVSGYNLKKFADAAEFLTLYYVYTRAARRGAREER